MSFKFLTFLFSLSLISGFTSLARADSTQSMDFILGKALFDRPWTSAPASTQATDGLGPLFNARSCVACHPKNGGGHIQMTEHGTIEQIGFLLRIGSETGQGDPTYGRQFQTNAIQAHAAEGTLSFEAIDRYIITKLHYGPMAPTTNHAGRLAQPLHGLGLLEQIPDATLLSFADPDDKNGDGISGRPHWVQDADGKTVLGRFARKATAPSLMQQTANAFKNDIGMSSPLAPAHAGDCTPRQPDCMDGPHGDSPQYDAMEISQDMLRLTTIYLQNLPAPQSSLDPEGLKIFTDVGCAACHIPEIALPEGQSVHAFTNLLLHDMGDALADGIREGDASGREWRTQPLWGLRHASNFLHDGRATTIEDAIAFHGGEAQTARESFLALPAQEKRKLLTFLSAL